MQNVIDLLREDMARVEQQFRQDLASDVMLIRKVGEYVLASGGKRVRPMLLLLAARIAGYQGDAAVGLASVVEFIHTATLLHDDVVDGADLRRGNASANAVWGNEASVLVGDFLFAKSFSIMVDAGNLQVLKALADATTMMAEGEVLQLVSTCDLEIDEERYINVVSNKTAVLMAAACQCGGVLAGINAEQESALHACGMDLGIAFQFMDDALDYIADEAEFGKARGQDLAEGKMTLPLIYALRQATAAEKELVATVVAKDEIAEADIDQVAAIIARYDGIAYTRKRASELTERAKQHLSCFPDSAARSAMFDLADYVVGRSL